MKLAWITAVLGCVACQSGVESPPPVAPDASSPDAPPAPVDAPPPEPDAAPAMDQTIVLLDGAFVHSQLSTDRTVTQDVELPPANQRYRKITLTLVLRCPTGGCDFWDRRASLTVVQNPGTPRETQVELLRFMTPYRVGMTAQLDVTDLRPVLSGRTTVRVFIDTWVHPGPEDDQTGADYGQGWLVDARLEYLAGEPERDAFAVVPIWGKKDGIVYGDPTRSSDQSATVEIPAGATGARLWTFVTGHGQGNLDNCAEFCEREQTLRVGSTPFRLMLWRDDCATTAAPGQHGNRNGSRAGWCPGAGVYPWIEDASAAIAGATSTTVRWSPEAYVNTCRAPLPESECRGCYFDGVDCVRYDGGLHAEPYYQLSSALILYR